MDHFFDDFWLLAPRALAPSCTWAFRRFLDICGIQRDPDKSQLPSTVWAALGVMFDLSTLSSQKLLRVKAKPSRKINIVKEMLKILSDKYFPPAHAARIFGKLDFLNQTLFGRVGRTGLLSIKKRQHEQPGTNHVDQELVAVLYWLIHLVATSPPREMRTNLLDEQPALLYTDGSSEPGRSPQHLVGAVLFLPGETPLYTWADVPAVVAESWLPAKNHIFQVELFACPLALDTFGAYLVNRPVIHFVDNAAALGSLVKGYSNNQDAIKIVADYWLRASSARNYIFVDRVESDSNISDDPSRMNEKGIMKQIGARHIPANLSSFVQNSSRDPVDWFGGKAAIQKILHALSQ
jgi:hypothetical protein